MYVPKRLSWEASLATGDESLDTQHKYLFEICNDLANAIEKQRGPEIIRMVLNVLMFYTEVHFKKEEECMERYHCAVAKRNQKAHATFIEKLKSYQSEHETSQSPDELAVKIHQYLTEWITTHIMHVDTKLHHAIHSKQELS